MSVDRGFTWMEDETIILIGIFSRSDIQEELRGAKRNITVYEKIAGELSSIGFSRTAYQCREKIKRLRKEYQHIKYCMQNNLTPKKPMKHYDLVDSIFNSNNSSEQVNAAEQNFHTSENEEDLQSSISHDKESDASNSFPSNEQIYPQSILPISSPLPELDCDNSEMLLEVKLTNSALMTQTDSDNTLFLNGEQSYDLSDKDSALEEIDSPWVPNVVLVENDSMKGDEEHTSDNVTNTEEELQDFNTLEEKSTISDSKEPPRKKKKCNVLKAVLENVADSFLKFQENAESRFLERITQLERERMKRDENMQKLWLEFEERRRKEEQQHELKMLSILGQFINQMTQNNVDHESL
ncbi:uncharacterized protein [Parasteatoda tepidariorum]|uniref:uncharacterized protein n=1 Tax=Parasteatoda tepidariorum TaxID=114398 RepID=UPI00077F955A|nr:uncharacterized protein LOC107437492 [Parasteatoda tepidariorum]